MARRRGFFAELNHQAQLAEKRRHRDAQSAARAHAAAQRTAEAARRNADRAARQAATASESQRKAADKEAQTSRLEARLAEVAEMNANLTETYSEIDSILAATLDVDDYVDLESFRITAAQHPPFDGGDAALPLPEPKQPDYPHEPIWREPAAPSGLSAAFGGKKKHADAVALARSDYERAVAHAQGLANSMHQEYQQLWTAYQQAEQARLVELKNRRTAYEKACQEREAEAAESNARLDRLINELPFDVPWAIQEYVGIVLSNSVYPDSFPVEHDDRFDLGSRELTLTTRVPPPSEIPIVKEYKYIKTKDEITATALSMRDQKMRYAGAVWQVAIRTLHEVFEADRVGRIHTISLTVDTTTLNPATGQPTIIPLVIVGADRETFSRFDLANVVPDATLAHLGATLSKSPLDLTPADTSRSVRSRAAQ